MPNRRPPRVISRPTPLRVVGVGENPRQGARRGVDLHVARSLTVGRFPPAGAGLPTRCRRSTRSGGDRYRSGRGGQQKRGVVHSHSHGDIPYPSTCFARHEPGPAVIELPSASYQPLTCQGEYTDITSIGRCTDRSNFPARKAVRLQRWHQLESPSQPVSVVPASFTDALSPPLSPCLAGRDPDARLFIGPERLDVNASTSAPVRGDLMSRRNVGYESSISDQIRLTRSFPRIVPVASTTVYMPAHG
jgi:hypothetical protein